MSGSNQRKSAALRLLYEGSWNRGTEALAARPCFRLKAVANKLRSVTGAFDLPLDTVPMEARSAEELPTGGEWQYEPKWKGLRCLASYSSARWRLADWAAQIYARSITSASKEGRRINLPAFCFTRAANPLRCPRQLRGGQMQDEKKPAPGAPAEPTKPLIAQIVEAVIDGAADIAKGVAVDVVARVAKSAENTEVGKAAVSLGKKAESHASKKPAKQVVAKKVRRKSRRRRERP
jgi:hypothetical protein